MKLLDRVRCTRSPRTTSRTGHSSTATSSAWTSGSLRPRCDIQIGTGLVCGDDHAVDARSGGTEPRDADGVATRTPTSAAAGGAAATLAASTVGIFLRTTNSTLTALTSSAGTASASGTGVDCDVRKRDGGSTHKNANAGPAVAATKTRAASAAALAAAAAATWGRRARTSAPAPALTGISVVAARRETTTDPPQGRDTPRRRTTRSTLCSCTANGSDRTLCAHIPSTSRVGQR
jgi:hypothetical protein